MKFLIDQEDNSFKYLIANNSVTELAVKIIYC